MRYIGIDYGSKRVGIAISDESGEFAIPVDTLAAGPGLIQEIKDLASENKTTLIVMGKSQDYDMKANKIQTEIESVKKQLEAVGLTVEFEQEFMTSSQAERLQGKNDMIDASAAALILQSFLDKKRNQTHS